MRRTLQLARPPRSIRRHEKAATSTSGELIEDRIFAIGDCADAFGAIQSGNSAYWQAEVAAKNVLRLIKRREGGEAEELQEYNPNPPMIKITLGMVSALCCCLSSPAS
jgi:NADH dehydrogenase FAD-containing subunit